MVRANATDPMLYTPLSTIWEGSKSLLRALKESSDAFAPLKATVGGLLAVIDHVEVGGCTPYDPCAESVRFRQRFTTKTKPFECRSN